LNSSVIERLLFNFLVAWKTLDFIASFIFSRIRCANYCSVVRFVQPAIYD